MIQKIKQFIQNLMIDMISVFIIFIILPIIHLTNKIKGD